MALVFVQAVHSCRLTFSNEDLGPVGAWQKDLRNPFQDHTTFIVEDLHRHIPPIGHEVMVLNLHNFIKITFDKDQDQCDSTMNPR